MSSTTTTSSCPRPFSSRTTLLPMNPAPPVTTIMAANASPSSRAVADQAVHRAAIRALPLPRPPERKMGLRVGVPEVHPRLGAVQRQVGARDLVAPLGIPRFELFLPPAVTFAHHRPPAPCRGIIPVPPD